MTLRSDLARVLAQWHAFPGEPEEWLVDMCTECADHILASDLIKQIRREAWNEGFDAGERDVFEHEAHKDGFDSPCVSNPYGEEVPDVQ